MIGPLTLGSIVSTSADQINLLFLFRESPGTANVLGKQPFWNTVYFQLHDKCLFGAPFTFNFVTNTYLGLSPLLQTRPEQIVFTQSLRYSQDLTCPYMLNLHFVSFSDWTFDPGVHSQHVS